MPTEGFDPSNPPARRGRRDQNIANAMIADQPAPQFVEGDPDNGEVQMLLHGDTVMAKVTHTVPFDGKDSWFTYGVQTHIQAGESEEDAFIRVATVVNQRVLDMAANAEDAVLELQQQYTDNNRPAPRR